MRGLLEIAARWQVSPEVILSEVATRLNEIPPGRFGA